MPGKAWGTVAFSQKSQWIHHRNNTAPASIRFRILSNTYLTGILCFFLYRSLPFGFQPASSFMYVTTTANLVHKPRTQKRRSQTTTENYTRARKTITRRIGLFFIGRASTTSPNCLVFNPLYESWKPTFKRMLVTSVAINSASKTLASRWYPRCI